MECVPSLCCIRPETIPEIFRRISGDKAAIRIDDPISSAVGLTPLFFSEQVKSLLIQLITFTFPFPSDIYPNRSECKRRA